MPKLHSIMRFWCRANTNASVYSSVGANASVYSLVGALGLLMRTLHITGPSPSHCSLGAGWDAAGGGGERGFSQHLTGERLVAVCDGARDAVKFQETGRIGGHSCMGDLGRPPVDQSICE